MAIVTPPFVLDGSYRRYDGLVIAGSPLRLFRLSAAGQRVAAAIEQQAELPPRHSKLTERLVDAGAIHPNPADSPFTEADVTIVVPSLDTMPTAALDDNVIVVDDGSEPPLSGAAAQRIIRLPVNRGPAAARNAGLAEVTTPLVAFVDTDVDLDAGWLQPLLRHFTDPRVALVAPRVVSSEGLTALAEYETVRSPLDLGDQPGRIAAGTRISYVPAAAILVRTDALRAIGGFDESLRTGEDVDMVWRLAAAGHRCRYEPASTVHHRPRPSVSQWLRQRVAYGRSAPALDRKHRGAVAPLRMSGWSAAVWALVFARRPVAAVAVAGGTIVALRKKVPDLPPAESLRLVGLGHLYAGRQVAGAITRVWWPVAVLTALIAPRTRLPLLGAALVAPLLDWFERRGPLDPVRYVAVHLADDVAYGTGVWIGAIELRTVGALAPRFTNWPGRTAG